MSLSPPYAAESTPLHMTAGLEPVPLVSECKVVNRYTTLPLHFYTS